MNLPSIDLKSVNKLLFSLLREKINELKQTLSRIHGFVDISLSQEKIDLYAVNEDVKNEILYAIIPVYVARTLISQECEYVPRPFIDCSRMHHIFMHYEIKDALEKCMLSSAFRIRCGCRVGESHLRFLIYSLNQDDVVDWLYETMGIEYHLIE